MVGYCWEIVGHDCGDAPVNPYIQAQILNMRSCVVNCKAACHAAAKQDDGAIDAEEEALLKKIDKCCWDFIRKLDKLT